MTPERLQEIRNRLFAFRHWQSFESGNPEAYQESHGPDMEALLDYVDELESEKKERNKWLREQGELFYQLKAENERLKENVSAISKLNIDLNSKQITINAENHHLREENDDLRNTRAVIKLLRAEEENQRLKDELTRVGADLMDMIQIKNKYQERIGKLREALRLCGHNPLKPKDTWPTSEEIFQDRSNRVSIAQAALAADDDSDKSTQHIDSLT